MAEPTEPHRFVILFQGRTGSSYLQDLLSSHPQVVCEPESLVRKSREEQAQWVRALYQAPQPPTVTAVGFKTKLKDIVDPAEFRDLLEGFGVRVVHMVRRNRVKQAFSRINARRLFESRRMWNLKEGQPPLPPTRVTLEQFQEALDHHAEMDAQLRRFLEGLDRPCLELAYEELLEDREGTLARLCRFLQVPEAPMTSRLQKNTPDSLREAFLNYDEIKDHYRGTSLEPQFE